MSKDAGLAGQASYSGKANDPRVRRNAQAALATNVQLGGGFAVGEGQRLEHAIGPGLIVRGGKLCLKTQKAPDRAQSATLVQVVNDLLEALKRAEVIR